MLRKRKTEEPTPQQERKVNLDNLTSCVQSNTGKQKVERLITQAESCFLDTLPVKYDVKELAKYITVAVFFASENQTCKFQISSKMMKIIQQEMKDCFCEYKIDFSNCSIVFYLVSNPTGWQKTKVIENITRTLVVTTADYDDIIDD